MRRGFVATIEMISAEVTIEAATARMAFLGPRRLVMRRNWARKYESRVRAADHAAWTRVVLSQGLLERVRVESRLPALSCKRGQRPAHETRWAAVGKRVMSKPISATITRATVSLTPGMVIRWSTAARKGARASPRRASTSRTAASRLRFGPGAT